MKRWKNSTCLGRERRVPLERPRGRGSSETARAVASSVTGVDISSSHMSPSPTTLSLFIAVVAVVFAAARFLQQADLEMTKHRQYLLTMKTPCRF